MEFDRTTRCLNCGNVLRCNKYRVCRGCDKVLEDQVEAEKGAARPDGGRPLLTDRQLAQARKWGQTV